MAYDGISLGGSNTRVTVKTVYDVVSEQKLTRLDFIKIDVEGFELDVLEGARNTINQLKPDVFLELNAFTLMRTVTKTRATCWSNSNAHSRTSTALREECRTQSRMSPRYLRSSTIISSNGNV
jgi:hypothetical protein